MTGSNVTVTCEVAVSPHVDAVIRMVPGFRAWMTPSESIVAIEVSDETKVIGTSVRIPPARFVAIAVTVSVSVARAGEWTSRTVELGSRNRSTTGLVTSHRNPGPEMRSSSQAPTNEKSKSALAAAVIFFVMRSPTKADNANQRESIHPPPRTRRRVNIGSSNTRVNCFCLGVLLPLLLHDHQLIQCFRLYLSMAPSIASSANEPFDIRIERYRLDVEGYAKVSMGDEPKALADH